MARSTRHAYDFIKDAFSPLVAVLTSEDAEMVSQKNGLSFVELIRPFCQLSKDVHIRDPVNPNVVIHIRNMKIKVLNLESPTPPPQLINKILSEVVSKSVSSVDLNTLKDTEMNSIIIVSTHNPDPMGAFVSLSAQQTAMQQSHKEHSNPYINWFSAHTFKYYILLHDISEGHEFKADAVFQSMKSVYGSHTCFLLQINSKAKMLPNSTETAPNSDLWNQFIYPFDDESLDISDDDDGNDVSVEVLSSSPGPTSQAEADKEEARILDSLEKAEKMAEEQAFSPSLRFQDPLMSMHYNESLETDETNDLGPLKPSPPDLVKDIPQYKRRMSQLKVTEYRKCMKQFTFERLPAIARNKETKKMRGQALTLLDHDRIKTFVYEFCVRGLLPHIEKMMRTLSEQILSRKGIHRSIFNVTKKWFGSTKNTMTHVNTGTTSGISYHVDSPELQQRKLGDLAFLVQHYELAFSSYHAAKREFNNDHAWIYFAGALEMAAISAFMQGPQKSYPEHYFEACISTYLNACRLPDYAARACLMSTEVLKAKKMYANAAVEFIKYTNEECDLRSALLLEQAAHCYLQNNPPMIRKYAFHMILAGHRFSKAVQRKHTLRCYTDALKIYKDKSWHLAEDHIHFISGRQCFNLGQLEDSQSALRNLLVYKSQQQPYQQASHLREFLAVFRQNVEKSKQSNKTSSDNEMPVLPLPMIDGQLTRVILTAESPNSNQLCDTPTFESPALDLNRTRTIVAGQCSFRRNYNKNYVKKWSEAEKNVVEKITGTTPYPWRPNIPCLSNGTDNSYHPKCIVGETFSVEVVFVNPLKVPLNLLNLHLLWEFTENETEEDQKQTIFSNQNEDHPSLVKTDVLQNIIVKGQEKKLVPLHLMFLKTGELKVIGVKYVLSSVSVINAIDDEGKIELNAVQDTTLLTFGVAGKQPLAVKGCRLNATKKERMAISYGQDFRLNPRILPAMPKLQIWMMNFPVTLLCGEVRMTQFVFKNEGKMALKNLHIYCNHPENSCIDKQSTTEDINSKESIYELVDKESVRHSLFDNTCDVDLESPLNVPLRNGLLLPGEEISVPVWIHGIATPGVHELDYLFYYEPEKPTSAVPYRVLHQTVRLQTLATLNLSACVRKSSSELFPTMDEVDNTDSSGCNSLISVHIENRAQGSAFPRCVEFTVLQISCFSRDMNFTNVSKTSSSYEKLRPGEALLMFLKANNNVSDSELSKVSQISFIDRAIDGTRSPAIDFFSRTNYSPTIKDKIQPNSTRTGLVIFWQTSYIDDSCVRHIIYGQTHAAVLEDVTSSHSLIQRQSLSPLSVSPSYDMVDHNWTHTPVQSSTNKLSIKLLHSSLIQHDFKENRICRIRVLFVVKNLSENEVQVSVKPKSITESSMNEKSQDATDAATIKAVSITTDNFAQMNIRDDNQLSSSVDCWIGKTRRNLKLGPFSRERIEFAAIVLHPGLYNLNGFEIHRVEKGKNIEVTSPDDEAITCVLNSAIGSLENDCLSDDIALLDL
eukprot:gene18865-20765_t